MVKKIKPENMDEIIEEMGDRTIIKKLNMFLYGINNDEDKKFELVTDADENTVKEIIEDYTVHLAKNLGTDNDVDGITEFFEKKGYYCSVNVSQR